jgi:hypothetical protein
MRTLTASTLLFATSLFACSYSWDVGPSPIDAGTTASSSAASSASSSTSSGDAGPDCNALVGSLGSKLAAAKKCISSASACATNVTDACGCTVAVGNASAAAVTDYLATIDAIHAAKCPLPCPACPAPSMSLCLVDAQQMTSCAP